MQGLVFYPQSDHYTCGPALMVPVNKWPSMKAAYFEKAEWRVSLKDY